MLLLLLRELGSFQVSDSQLLQQQQTDNGRDVNTKRQHLRRRVYGNTERFKVQLF